jgi:hypothetical protein
MEKVRCDYLSQDTRTDAPNYRPRPSSRLMVQRRTSRAGKLCMRTVWRTKICMRPLLRDARMLLYQSIVFLRFISGLRHHVSSCEINAVHGETETRWEHVFQG